MRGAARQPPEDPEPTREDLDAKAARLLDGQMELVSRATALLDRCPDPLLVRHLIAEISRGSIHTEELRSEMARLTAAIAGNDHIAAALRDRDREQAANAAVPAPRHRHRARWQPGEGQRALFSVKTIPGIAVAALVALRPLAKAARHAVAHPAALTAHTARVAAGAVTGAGVAATAVVLVLVPNVTHGQPGASATGAASVPGWHTSASPIPSSSLIALTKPKPKHGKKQLMAASGLPLLCCSPAPSASAPQPSSSAPSVQASVQAGPAVLSVSTTALDLTSLTSETITLSATGSGWVSWKVALPADPLTQAAQTDLDFSQDHGVLQAGESTTITVSLDPSQLLDGNLTETFEIGGVSVRATLPQPPVPVPSVLPSTLPSVLPSI